MNVHLGGEWRPVRYYNVWGFPIGTCVRPCCRHNTCVPQGYPESLIRNTLERGTHRERDKELIDQKKTIKRQTHLYW